VGGPFYIEPQPKGLGPGLGQCPGMSPERDYSLAVPPRVRLYVILLRIGLALLPVAVIVGFAFSDRIAGALPHTWWTFAGLFAVLLALLVWVGATTEAREHDPLIRGFIRITAATRSKMKRR
jgi:hypothetical protein